MWQAYAQSDLLGKGIFLALFALSALTWVLILHKAWLLRTAKKHASHVRAAFQKRRHAPLTLETQAPASPFLSLYRQLKQQTLELLGKNRRFLAGEEEARVFLSPTDIAELETELAQGIDTQVQTLEHLLFLLSTIVTLAPFLGLLGTVWGILETFMQLQSHGGGGGSDVVLGGLSMALGTTVVGLIVAIPALIGYNYLKAKIDAFAAEMESFSHLLLSSVALQYRQVDAVSCQEKT